MALRTDQEWMIDYWMFFDLCARFKRAEVGQVYIAVQAALAYNAKQVDVGPLLSRIRPPGYKGLDDGYTPNIGMSGLAFFYWLYDTVLIREGSTDYHTYNFTRKYDKKSTEVTLKTTCDPRGDIAINAYERQLSKLRIAREKLFVTVRYGTSEEFLFGK